MSKIDFNKLVESLLLETQQDFITAYQSKIPGLDLTVLTAIYDLLSPKGYNYVAAKVWEPYTDFTPVLSVITNALGGTFKSARDKIKNNPTPITTADEFYTAVKPLITPSLEALIKPLDRYTPSDPINPEVRDTHSRALRLKSSNVLVQNVWPQLANLTIVDAISTILKNRLTGLEKLQLKFFVPLNKISEIATGGNYDNIMSDVFKNYEAYSGGSKKYNKDIVEVLRSIDIIPEDFVKVATHTNDLYKLLLNNKFISLADDVRKKLLKDSLTYENIWNFAKRGILTHVQTSATTTSRATYTLKFIETNKTDPGNLLIEQIKSMSSGVRVKDQTWQQKLQQFSQAAGALASFGGAKLYG